MKKFFFIFTLVLCLLGAGTVVAIDLGTNLAGQAAQKAGYAPANETSFAQILGSVVKAVLSFAGVIFLSLMVYAGFLWMNARGDEAQIDKSKDIIKSAVIGLIITVGAYNITSFVVPRVLERTATGDGSTRTETPTVGCCTISPPGATGAPEFQQSNGFGDCNAMCDARTDDPNNPWVCAYVEVEAGECHG